MLVVRNVFQAKYGMGEALVKVMMEAEHMFPNAQARIMTDAAGRFFTVISEFTYADFADYEAGQKQGFSHPDFAAWFAKMTPLVESGQREFWNVVFER